MNKIVTVKTTGEIDPTTEVNRLVQKVRDIVGICKKLSSENSSISANLTQVDKNLSKNVYIAGEKIEFLSGNSSIIQKDILVH